MSSITDFRTHGAVIDTVDKYLKAALADAHKRFFGTNQFLERQLDMAHQAFDRFAADHGVQASETPRLRQMLTAHCRRYPRQNSTGMRLLEAVPSSCMVRGEWVSPRAVLITH